MVFMLSFGDLNFITAEELNIGDDMHKNCRVQLEQVQEEFGRYKLRAQSVLKNKSKVKLLLD